MSNVFLSPLNGNANTIFRSKSAVNILQSMIARGKGGRGRAITVITLKIVARWGWVVKARPRPLYPRERAPARITQEAGWAPEPVWKGMERWKYPGSNPEISSYCDYAVPAPRTHCVAYTINRHVRKSDRFTARLVSPKCVLAHALRLQKKTSDYPSTHSRAFAFPHDMTHTVVARFATDIFVRLCCPQWFARFSDFETPIRTRTRHHPKPLDRKRWFFAILQVFAVHNRKQHSFLFQQMSLWTALQMFIPSQYRSHYIPPATLTKLSPLSGRYREILITAH